MCTFTVWAAGRTHAHTHAHAHALTTCTTIITENIKAITDSSARGVRQPAAGVEWVVGRRRRPRRRSPRAPRGHDPTPPAGGPVPGRARLTPAGAGTPSHAGTQSLLSSLAPGPVGRAGRRVGWSRPPWSRPPAGRAGAPCGDRPAAGPAGPKPGPARTHLRARTCARKGWRRAEAPVRPAAPDRGRGRGALV